MRPAVLATVKETGGQAPQTCFLPEGAGTAANVSCGPSLNANDAMTSHLKLLGLLDTRGLERIHSAINAACMTSARAWRGGQGRIYRHGILARGYPRDPEEIQLPVYEHILDANGIVQCRSRWLLDWFCTGAPGRVG